LKREGKQDQKSTTIKPCSLEAGRRKAEVINNNNNNNNKNNNNNNDDRTDFY